MYFIFTTEEINFFQLERTVLLQLNVINTGIHQYPSKIIIKQIK